MVKRSRSQRKSELISIVIPAFNEAENLQALYNELQSVLKPLPYTFEIIFVDDGSTDSTLDIISALATGDDRVKGLAFSRNFGHQAALIAGLDAASGDAVITMDGDLQHPPRLIPELVKQWKEGFDVVYTVRRETAGASGPKLAFAKLFYSIMNRIANIDLPPNTADFRLMDRMVVDKLKQMEERSLFLRGLIRWIGFRQAALTYDAEERHAGTTKYSWRKMLQLAVDGVTSFSRTPLTLALYLGFVISGLSFVYVIYALYMHFFTAETVPGWTSLLVTVLFLGGIQLITLGIIGLYLGKLYDEVKRRPRYLVRATVGHLKRVD